MTSTTNLSLVKITDGQKMIEPGTYNSNLDAIDAAVGTNGNLTGNMTIGGTLAVTGAQTLTGNTSAGNLTAGTLLQGNVTVNVGKDASAGTLNIYPTTTAKGHIAITAADSAGNTTTALVNASQAAARTYTIADAGGNATLAFATNSPLVTTIARCSSALTKNASTTYANVTGLTATVVVGTYAFKLRLPSTVAGGTEGIKYCFNYTTAVLSALEATARGFTASAVAVQHTTTTTTQTDLFTQTAVVLWVEIDGTFTVSTGGTIDVQMAQSTSGATNTVALVGGYAEFTRIA